MLGFSYLDQAGAAEWKVLVSITSRLLSILPENSRKVVVGMMTPQFQEVRRDSTQNSQAPLTKLFFSV